MLRISKSGSAEFLFAAALLFIAGSAGALEQSASFNGPRVVGPFSTEHGYWHTKVQSVFDSAKRELFRKRYVIWDRSPRGTTYFEWQPDKAADQRSGPIAGPGRLTWHHSDKPAYDPLSKFSQLRGTFHNGRLEGTGTYIDQTGLAYEGTWKNGQAWGFGTLTLQNGDTYIGSFRSGAAEGRGKYVDTAGEIYDGQFAKGQRHGHGSTTLPTGRSYVSHWTNGKEDGKSSLIRLAQFSGRILPGGNEDVRMNVGVDRLSLPNWDYDSDEKAPLLYAAKSNGPVIEIRPRSARLVNLWKGQGPVQLSLAEEKNEDGTGVFDFSEGDLLPLMIRVEVQNKSASPIQIEGLFLDVEKSVSENKPAIQMRSTSSLNCNRDPRYTSQFSMENLGWSAAENSTLKLQFENTISGDRTSGFSAIKSLGSFDKAVIVDFKPELDALGVDTEYLESIAEEGFVCKSNSQTQCLANFRATGKLGALANRVQLNGKSFSLKFLGTLNYSWKDAEGKNQTWTNGFPITIPMGFVRREENCGAEGGAPQVITTKTQKLKSDGVAYKVAVSYQTVVSPSHSTPLLFAINAPKSSTHDFSIVLQLSDGREIKSRPINLLYYQPRWNSDELPSGTWDSDDQPPDEPEIQSADRPPAIEHVYKHELIGPNLRRVRRADAYYCEKLCADDSACKGWSFQYQDRKCNLKSSADLLRLDARFSSGLKAGVSKPSISPAPTIIEHFQNKSLSGYTYLVDLLTTRDECERQCKVDEKDCAGFTFKKKTAECHLLGSLKSIRSAKDSESGIKQQTKQ